MRYLLSLGAACLLLNLPLIADSEDEEERLKNARMVLKAILDTPDEGIPSELLNKAECVLVFPGVKKGAFIFGASYGKGPWCVARVWITRVPGAHRQCIGWPRAVSVSR